MDGRSLVQAADERYRGGPDRRSRARSCSRSSATARRWCCPVAREGAFDRVESLEQMADMGELVQVLGAGADLYALKP